MIGGPEIIAALLGATAAGFFQLLDKVFSRRRRAESILVAIASEVRSICDLIEHQRYAEAVSEQVRALRAGAETAHGYVIDIRSNYFSVFESVTSEIGLLRPAQISKIVAFYAYCKSVIDSTRPDGPFAAATDRDDVVGNLLGLEGTLAAILHLGAEIVSLTRKPLPSALEL